jgi:hypothetical protein
VEITTWAGRRATRNAYTIGGEIFQNGSTWKTKRLNDVREDTVLYRTLVLRYGTVEERGRRVTCSQGHKKACSVWKCRS